MTSNQVLELDLSEVQFEEVSDEKASIIQGGTGGGNGENGNGDLDPDPDPFPGVIDSFTEFFGGLSGVGSLEELTELQAELIRDLTRELNL